MNANRPEFSRIVSLAQLGSEPFHQEIAATEPEREALARRFDLIALDRLAADVELIRQEADFILLRASFEAAVAQEFSLALPSFPRSPGAVVEIEEPPREAGPFAALARLTERRDR
jgi:hypothetical protein